MNISTEIPKKKHVNGQALKYIFFSKGPFSLKDNIPYIFYLQKIIFTSVIFTLKNKNEDLMI